MTLWQNELSVFRIKIVPFAKLPRLGNDWFHFHSVWARHQNQWKSLLKWCEKNYTDWVSNQNNKFLRLVDVNLNLIMLVTVFTPPLTHPSANLTNHPTAPTLHFLLIIIIFLLQASLSEKLLIQRAETSPYYSNLWKDHLISWSIYQVFLLSVTLSHRQSLVIIWCFGSSVWNLNLKKVLNHGYRIGEVVPTYINGLKLQETSL